MNPLDLILSIIASLPIAQTYQNQTNAQGQAFQRQLSASDFAGDPQRFLGRLGNLLGQPGAASNQPGGGVGGVQGLLQSLIQKFTQGGSANLTNNVWQQLQPKLAASGLSQAPGIANEEMSTALAPFQIQEQQLGASEGSNALNTALQTEETNLGYPFKLGSGVAGQFPNIAAL